MFVFYLFSLFLITKTAQAYG